MPGGRTSQSVPQVFEEQCQVLSSIAKLSSSMLNLSVLLWTRASISPPVLRQTFFSEIGEVISASRQLKAGEAWRSVVNNLFRL